MSTKVIVIGKHRSKWVTEVGETRIVYEARIYHDRLMVKEQEFFIGVTPKVLVRVTRSTWPIGKAPHDVQIEDTKAALEIVRRMATEGDEAK